LDWFSFLMLLLSQTVQKESWFASSCDYSYRRATTCVWCVWEMFQSQEWIVRHKTVHSEEKPFVCPECGLSFGQKRYLNNHEKSWPRKNSGVPLTLMGKCEFIMWFCFIILINWELYETDYVLTLYTVRVTSVTYSLTAFYIDKV
jgi:predicted RNA-binding Zn-ribbon protein involved in translation (DUF1610 family)